MRGSDLVFCPCWSIRRVKLRTLSGRPNPSGMERSRSVAEVNLRELALESALE
jgi:hypothetical protein